MTPAWTYILCIEWQVWIDAGVDVHPVPIDMHRREFVHPAEVLLGNDRDVNWLTLPLSIGDQGGAASVFHPPSRPDRMATAMPHHVLVVAFEADELQVARHPVHQALDDLAALRAAIDVVTERHDGGRPGRSAR